MSSDRFEDDEAFAEHVSGRVEQLDDVALVELLLMLLQEVRKTDRIAIAARCSFVEVGSRWIPLDVFAPAFSRAFDIGRAPTLSLIEGGDDAS